MPSGSLEFVNEAVTQLMVGFGLALLNIVIEYFAPWFPRYISVLRWKNRTRALVFAYLIALVIQLVTSPFFRSLIHPTSIELAWSPYQALFNVVGVILMDLLVIAWNGLRRGAEVGRQQFDIVKERAADQLDELGAHLPLSGEQGAEQEARRQAREESEAQAVAERKKRVDDRLKDY